MVEPRYSESNTANWGNLLDPGAWRQALGNTVEDIGGYLGIPETGWSERIAGGATPKTVGVARADTINPYANAYSQTISSPVRDSSGADISIRQAPPVDNTGKTKQQMWEEAGHAGIAPEGYGGENAGGGGVSGQDISDAYAPAIAALQGYIDAAQTGAAADIENIGTRVKNQSGQLDVQEGELMGETQISQNKFHEDLTSALQDAIRSYNALAQQGNARFGRGSSAGGAVGELAQQEFFRQQGGVQKQGLSGDLQFEGEKTKIKNFVAKGKQDLDMYLNEATTEIQKGLRQTLADINSRRGDIETNKTRDRLSALQTAKETAQRVSEANVTYRQGLITTALSNMQSVAGRAFTPTEIAANLRELQNLIFGNSGGFTTLASPQTVARTRAFTDVEDPYAQTQVGQ